MKATTTPSSTGHSTIPKIIHLCWFSNDPYPLEIKICLESWQRLVPDYQIRLWSYEDAKAIGCPYIDQALSVRKWAFAADAVRFYAVHTEGGVYMDSDILLLKRFDEFIPESGFAGFNERWPGQTVFGLQAAFFMAEKGNAFCKEVFDYYNRHDFLKPDGTPDETISPLIASDIATRHGFAYKDEKQCLEGMTIYPTYYISPFRSYPRHADTFAVHTIYGSWRKRKFGRKIELALKHALRWLKYHLARR